ncbi:MAG: molecular chaperone DnaJ [Candidatus Komeilibacteria bacterium]|nr:molecular chaperone DnaJ [Candidatus Komeilibacteria bacterium]
MSKDYYQILGVDKNASAEEIKKAFRKKAHEHHPDKGNGTDEKFKEVNEAYQVLGNSDKKRRYDQFGSSDFSGFGNGGGQPGGGFNWSDFARQQGGQYQNSNFDFSDLGDIFGDFFGSARAGGSRSSARSNKGADLEVNVSITLEEDYFGVDKNFTLNKDVVCAHCHGNGAEPDSKINTCKTCNGQGQVYANQQTFFGAFRTVVVCPDCAGEGKIPERKCSRCNGRGIVKDQENLVIHIPAGINDGQTLKLSGKGNIGLKGAGAGDLFVNIRVLPHAEFVRQGDDLQLRQTIPFTSAVLGEKININTFEGEVKLKIPAGTSSGQEFSIKGKGLPHLNKKGQGNLLVKVSVAVPKHLSSSQKDLLERLKREGL